jgi:phosphatidylethanolamine-binding protein (PEBP) family uncharacterized protein
MSLQTDLVTLLAGLFSTRFYPGVAPPKTATPYAVYTRVHAAEQATLDVNGGTGNASNTIMQIDVYASTYDAAQASTAAVKTALKGWATENTLESEQDMYEPDTKLHRVMLTLSAWHF